MGTRADFYIGRGKTATWLGSIAWDGYPVGMPSQLVKTTTEEAFRAEVANILATCNSATTPEQGWPWPWEDSGTTDYAYAWDGGAWGSCFGGPWWPADNEPDHPTKGEPKAEFPTMKTEKSAPAGSHRSGIMVIQG